MNNQRKDRAYKILVGQFSVLLLIVAISLYLIFYSQGLKINLKTFKIYKTGLLLIEADSLPDKVTINGENYTGKKQFFVNLLPGSYSVTVSKSGFVTWNKEVVIKRDLISSNQKVILFKENPEILTLTETSKIDLINAPNSILAENATDNMAFNDYEIWIGTKLVTRFSTPITNVKWHTDLEHILFQLGDEIRIIDSNGFNNTLLVKLSNNQSTKFQIGGRGSELYFLDSGEYKKAVIK